MLMYTGPAGADYWLGGSSTKSKSHFGLLISVQDILDLTTDENFLNTVLVEQKLGSRFTIQEKPNSIVPKTSKDRESKIFINQYVVSDIVFAFCLHLSELEKPRAGWREGRTVEKDDLSSAHQDNTHKSKDTNTNHTNIVAQIQIHR